MLNKIENIEELVKQMLTSFAETRENDRLLALKIWSYQDPNLRSENGPTFLVWGRRFMNGEFADYESIRRSRQKLQEKYPHLRGVNYKSRKAHAGDMREAMRS
jgi:hypothetical protein